MPTKHTVKAGDCMTSLAAAYGFSSYKAIAGAPENAELKKKRPSPARLVPGDEVVIPDKPTKEEPAETDKSTTFVVARPKARAIIDLRVDGEFGYELVVDGKDRFEGKTKGKKPIEHPIEPDAARGELFLWPETLPDGSANTAREGQLSIPVLFGHLRPIEDPAGPVIGGVQGALANLGHYGGPIGGPADTALAMASIAFKHRYKVRLTPDVDDDLCAALKKVHG